MAHKTEPGSMDEIQRLFCDLDPLINQVAAELEVQHTKQALRKLKQAFSSFCQQWTAPTYRALAAFFNLLSSRTFRWMIFGIALMLFLVYVFMMSLSTLCDAALFAHFSTLLSGIFKLEFNVCEMFREHKPYDHDLQIRSQQSMIFDFVNQTVPHYSNIKGLPHDLSTSQSFVTDTSIELHRLSQWVNNNPAPMYEQDEIAGLVAHLQRQLNDYGTVLDGYVPSLLQHAFDHKQRAKALHLASKAVLKSNLSKSEGLAFFLRVFYHHICPSCHKFTDEGRHHSVLLGYINHFIRDLYQDTRSAESLKVTGTQIVFTSQELEGTISHSLSKYRRICGQEVSAQQPGVVLFPFAFWFQKPRPFPPQCRIDPREHLSLSKSILDKVSCIVQVATTDLHLQQRTKVLLDRLSDSLAGGKVESESLAGTIEAYIQKDAEGMLGFVERLQPALKRLVGEEED